MKKVKKEVQEVHLNYSIKKKKSKSWW